MHPTGRPDDDGARRPHAPGREAGRRRRRSHLQTRTGTAVAAHPPLSLSRRPPHPIPHASLPSRVLAVARSPPRYVSAAIPLFDFDIAVYKRRSPSPVTMSIS